MMKDYRMDRRDGHRSFEAREGFDGGPSRRFHHGDFEGRGEPRDMPRGRGEGFGPRAMPRGGRGGFEDGFQAMPGRPGGHGFPPGGMPPFGGPGGLPPRRPDPEFLKRRVEEADLGELLDMAHRLSRRLPQGNPAHAQALILSILAGRDELSQRQLQQMLGIQPGSLSELISKLESKGLLTREKAADRRGNLLRITEAGRAALPQSEDTPEEDPFAPLTPDQQDQLAALLRALLTGWAERLKVPTPRAPREDKPVEV